MRDTFVVMVMVAAAFAVDRSTAAVPDGVGWVDLLADGLRGWVEEGKKSGEHTQPEGVWSINSDGELHCDGRGFGFLRYDQRLRDFDFYGEYSISPGGNSGIGIRSVAYESRPATRPSHAAYELQIIDRPAVGPKGNMSLYRHLAPSANPLHAAGAWNAVEIVCRGPRIMVRYNGELVHDVDQRDHESLQNKPLEGFLLLQNHHSKVAFRHLRLRPLSDGHPATRDPASP